MVTLAVSSEGKESLKVKDSLKTGLVFFFMISVLLVLIVLF
jgi:hypothetical protein